MTLEVAFLDVGNADCVVLQPPTNRALIIDAPSDSRLRLWLAQCDIHHIESIYITHGHSDHLPSLQHLATFLEEWFDKRHGTVNTLYLPNDIYEAIEKSYQGETLAEHNPPRRKLFEDALGKLRLWRKRNLLHIFRSEGSGHPHQYAELSIHILHPDAFFVADFHGKHKGRVNDIALVLRIEYGAFRVLLPSDIEKEGLRDMLERCSDDELHCNILKIPYHGAWQADAQATETFFNRSNPELAILSVGSTNQYGHVRPGLFRALIQLQGNQRLQRFICTQITRTCKHTALERAEMGKQGLSSPQPCAGTIVIVGEQSGEWTVCDQEAHGTHVDTIEQAACRGCADLADDDEANNQHRTSDDQHSPRMSSRE